MKLTRQELIDALRSTGKPVHIYPGEYFDGGDFTPYGVVNHQTAGPPISTARMPNYIRNVLLKPSRSRPGEWYPLCQIAIDGQGAIWLTSAGRAAHAMLIGAEGIEAIKHGRYPLRRGLYTGYRSGASKNGNQYSYGIEITNNSGEAIRNGVQWETTVLVNTALIRALGQSAGSVLGHGEQGTDREPQLDPGFDVGELRVEVDRLLNQFPPIGGGAGGGGSAPGEDDEMSAEDVARLEGKLDTLLARVGSNDSAQIDDIQSKVGVAAARLPENTPQVLGRLDARMTSWFDARNSWTYDAMRTVVVPLLTELAQDSNVDNAKLDEILAKLDEIAEPAPAEVQA